MRVRYTRTYAAQAYARTRPINRQCRQPDGVRDDDGDRTMRRWRRMRDGGSRVPLPPLPSARRDGASGSLRPPTLASHRDSHAEPSAPLAHPRGTHVTRVAPSRFRLPRRANHQDRDARSLREFRDRVIVCLLPLARRSTTDVTPRRQAPRCVLGTAEPRLGGAAPPRRVSKRIYRPGEIAASLIFFKICKTFEISSAKDETAPTSLRHLSLSLSPEIISLRDEGRTQIEQKVTIYVKMMSQ